MTPLQLVVRTILERADAHEWSVQGFGLLRLYMRQDARLHIWDPTLAYPNVSMIHNHSWNLRSTVVVGVLRNQRYSERVSGVPYSKKVLVTGYNTSDVTGVSDCFLDKHATEVYAPGDVYSQRANEIHETLAEPYTVTLMERNEPEYGEATVYWPRGSSWGTAQPRRATLAEVRAAAEAVLSRYFP